MMDHGPTSLLVTVDREEVDLEKKMEKVDKVQDCLGGLNVEGHVVPECGANFYIVVYILQLLF